MSRRPALEPEVSKRLAAVLAAARQTPLPDARHPPAALAAPGPLPRSPESSGDESLGFELLSAELHEDWPLEDGPLEDETAAAAWVPDDPRHRDAGGHSSGRWPTGRGRHRRQEPAPAVLTVPTSLRGANARPRVLAVVGVLAALVLALTVFGVRVAAARAAATPRPVAGPTSTAPDGLVVRSLPPAFATASLSRGSPGTAGATATTAAGQDILVHVVGQVRRPGVVHLPAGSRVLDAVNAAGGQTPKADLAALNLARLVTDGEQVVVPKPGEAAVTGGGGQGSSSASGGAGAADGGTPTLVDLNSADVALLDTLPGVGPVLAQRIVDWRTEHGRFTSVDELGEVSGIGEKILAQLTPKVRV